MQFDSWFPMRRVNTHTRTHGANVNEVRSIGRARRALDMWTVHYCISNHSQTLATDVSCLFFIFCDLAANSYIFAGKMPVSKVNGFNGRFSGIAISRLTRFRLSLRCKWRRRMRRRRSRICWRITGRSMLTSHRDVLRSTRMRRGSISSRRLRKRDGEPCSLGSEVLSLTLTAQ